MTVDVVGEVSPAVVDMFVDVAAWLVDVVDWVLPVDIAVEVVV